MWSPFKPNMPIDEKRISLIEKVVVRIARGAMLSGKARGLITPYPISNAIFGDNIRGPVLRYMFPCDGTITKGLIHFGSRLRNGIKLSVYISSGASNRIDSFTIDNESFLIEPNVEIISGSRLTVSVDPINPEEVINEVWISFLWVPSIRDVDAKSFLISELEGDLLEEGSEE